MDTDKLVKAIQIIVKEEIKVLLPKLVKEGVKKEMAKLLKENKQLKEVISKPKQPTFMDESVSEEPIQVKKKFSNNPALNEVLAQTQPFNAQQRQSTDEDYRTMSFTSNDTHTLGASNIAQQMGYGDMSPKQGLGVQTGNAGLDKALNRDYSGLMKAINKKKGPFRPGM
jgi:CRISPR/Cas system-associated protein Cas7 (RAMP superfamily)